MEIMEYELIRISKSGKFITIHRIITNVHKSYVSPTLKVCGPTQPIGSMTKCDSQSTQQHYRRLPHDLADS